jgi:DNA polymerase-3 subunit delta
MAPSTILGAALRHAFALLPICLEVEGGKPAGVAVESWRGLHFRRKPLVQRQLQRWTAERMTALVATLQARVLETRRLPDLGPAIAARTLLEIANAARR